MQEGPGPCAHLFPGQGVGFASAPAQVGGIVPRVRADRVKDEGPLVVHPASSAGAGLQNGTGSPASRMIDRASSYLAKAAGRPFR